VADARSFIVSSSLCTGRIFLSDRRRAETRPIFNLAQLSILIPIQIRSNRNGSLQRSFAHSLCDRLRAMQWTCASQESRHSITIGRANVQYGFRRNARQRRISARLSPSTSGTKGSGV